MSDERCWHESWTGVDQTPIDDPNKLWQCDGCAATGTEAELYALMPSGFDAAKGER